MTHDHYFWIWVGFRRDVVTIGLCIIFNIWIFGRPEK